MGCERYTELLSARLDGELSGEETRELEEHLSQCPQCRALAAQLDQVKQSFAGLEELEAPQGFARDVIYAINRQPKILPLFRRLQKQAMAVAAAGIVLMVALYGPHTRQNGPEAALSGAGMAPSAASGEEVLAEKHARDLPLTAAYGLPEPEERGEDGTSTDGAPAAAPQPCTAGKGEDDLVPPEADAALILDRLPDGAGELIPPEVTVSHDGATGADVYTWLTAQELAAIEALAVEQGLLPSATESDPAPERCALIVRNK